MKKQEQFMSVIIILIGSYLALSSVFAFAEELTVEFIIDPDIRTIDLAAPQQVTIVARPSKDDVTFRWKHDGIGTLQGNEGDAGQIYLPPQDANGDMTQTTISVLVTDKQGKTATASVTFTLKKPPMPTATPTETPIPTATATPTLTPAPTEIPEPTATPTLKPSPTATATEIPEPTATPTKIPTIKPTNTPKPTATPDIPIEMRLDAIKRRLASSLERYKQLKIQEEEGKAVGKEMINVLTDLVATLKELEYLYVHSEQAEMLEKVPGVRQAREKFADELSRRKQ